MALPTGADAVMPKCAIQQHRGTGYVYELPKRCSTGPARQHGGVAAAACLGTGGARLPGHFCAQGLGHGDAGLQAVLVEAITRPRARKVDAALALWRSKGCAPSTSSATPLLKLRRRHVPRKQACSGQHGVNLTEDSAASCQPLTPGQQAAQTARPPRQG